MTDVKDGVTLPPPIRKCSRSLRISVIRSTVTQDQEHHRDDGRRPRSAFSQLSYVRALFYPGQIGSETKRASSGVVICVIARWVEQQ
jgi:hypothetical protein